MMQDTAYSETVPVAGYDAEMEALRVPPHSIEAEQSVLGGLMLDNAAWEQVAGLLAEEDFYRREHRLLFRAIVELEQRDSPFDLVTVKDWLDQNDLLAQAGGFSYIGLLVNNTPTAANIEAYANIVHERSVLRSLIHVGTSIANSAYKTEGRKATELLDLAERQVFEIAEKGMRAGGGFASVRQLATKAIDRIDELFNSQDPITGVATGYADFDEMTSGLQASDLIIVAGRPSMGKCVASGTRIPDPVTGRLRTIDEMVRKKEGDVLSLEDNLRVRAHKATVFVDDGFKPTFRVTTRLGRTVTTTASHPFLTPNGWLPLAELKVGGFIAVPRRLPLAGNQSLPEGEIKLLAYFLGDGGTTTSSPCFTNGNPLIQQDFKDAVTVFSGMECVPVPQPDRTPGVRVVRSKRFRAEARRRFAAWLNGRLEQLAVSGRLLAEWMGLSPASIHHWRKAHALPHGEAIHQLVALPGGDEDGALKDISQEVAHQRSPTLLVRFLDKHGISNRLAAQKRVPDAVFSLPPAQLALFLNRLFSCDGSAWIQNGEQAVVGYGTASEGLAQDVVHLLLRFGIIAKLRRRQVRYTGDFRPFFEVRITHVESLRCFVDEIGIFGKEDRLAEISKLLARKYTDKSNIEGVPASIWTLIEEEKGSSSWQEIYGRLGMVPPSNFHRARKTVGRRRVRELARLLQSARLAIHGDNDVLWDPIVSIEAMGMQQVYDLSVPEHANFIADDVFVHNTSFAINIAEHVAIKSQMPVAVFSMEMPGEQLVMRMMSSLGRIDQHRVRTGKLDDDDWPRLTSAVGILSEIKMFIDDTPALSPTEIRARCRRLIREQGALGLVVIDYLQLMQVAGTTENRTTEISEISRSLKSLAKELQVPVVALSQLNRSLEQRPNKRPVMSDLRESGAIEQDADVIVFIYRDEVYDPDSADKGTAEIIIGKQRNGPIGTVRLTFLGQYTRFENFAAPRYEDED